MAIKTLMDFYNLVRDAAQNDPDNGLHKLRISIGESPTRLQEIWDVTGDRILADIWHAARSGKGVSSNGDGPPTLPKRWGTSWRDKFKSGSKTVWDVVWPVGCTGERKPLGDFTQPDLLETERYYLKISETARKNSKPWGEAAAKAGDKTLREIAGKLSASSAEYFVGLIARGWGEPSPLN